MNRKRSNSGTLLRANSRSSLERLMFESEQCNGPINSHNHSFLYRLVQCLVFICRMVTPFSYLWLICVCYGSCRPGNCMMPPAVWTAFTLWMLAEAIFFPYYYHLFTKLNTLNRDLQHFASDPESRMLLAKKCFAALKAGAQSLDDPPELYIRKVLEGWFLDEPLTRVSFDNMAAWTGWAFFGKDTTTMSELEIAENNSLVRYLEEMASWNFPPGFTNDLPTLRLNLDPIFATQRPFFFYAAIGMINWATHALMAIMGFRLVQHAALRSRAQNIYYRPAVPSDDRTPRLPIVFMHGIGVGFAHYLGLIACLPRDVDIFLVEWPYVAMQLTTSAPTVDEAVNHVIAVLDYYHHPRACFVAHSLGTSLVSWMLHDERGARRVGSSILLDPVVFLLCDPTVASVFVYKDPDCVVDLLMHFFLSRELFIANALSRHFAWSHNILFVEDLLNNRECCRARSCRVVPSNHGRKRSEAAHGEKPSSARATAPHFQSHKDIDHSIFLSTRDSIVPIPPVCRYLQTKAEEGFRNFELVLFDGLHGELLLRPKWVRRIAETVRERIKNVHS